MTRNPGLGRGQAPASDSAARVVRGQPAWTAPGGPAAPGSRVRMRMQIVSRSPVPVVVEARPAPAGTRTFGHAVIGVRGPGTCSRAAGNRKPRRETHRMVGRGEDHHRGTPARRAASNGALYVPWNVELENGLPRTTVAGHPGQGRCRRVRALDASRHRGQVGGRGPHGTPRPGQRRRRAALCSSKPQGPVRPREPRPEHGSDNTGGTGNHDDLDHRPTSNPPATEASYLPVLELQIVNEGLIYKRFFTCCPRISRPVLDIERPEPLPGLMTDARVCFTPSGVTAPF